jgi:UDPglucose 6-dehydrogenase
MKVAVVGTGYVGLVVGACLAETGNDVICADVDERKIKDLQQNRLPIYEPGLEPLVEGNQAAGRLSFTTDVGAAVEASYVVIIAVGTPPDEDGSADLQHVLRVAETIGEHMNGPKIVMTKSTVPVGTAEKVRRTIAARTNERLHVCSSPEFLKEGAAIDDFMKPDRVVVGADSKEAEDVLRELHSPFIRTGNPLIFMDTTSAELTKYAGIGSDTRIGSSFLFPGPGYGGSCFPKDVKALIRTADELDVKLDIMEAVEAVNARQKQKLRANLEELLGGRLDGRTIAVWGLAFKAKTDDVRESPAVELIEDLLTRGARVRAHDPKALDSARHVFGDRITYADKMYEALSEADALAIVTEWLEYRNPDFQKMRDLLRQPIIVDGRNLYEPSRMRELGFSYRSMGRKPVG